MGIKMINEKQISKVNFPEGSVFLKLSCQFKNLKSKEVKIIFQDFFEVTKSFSKIFEELIEGYDDFFANKEEILEWIVQPIFEEHLYTTMKLTKFSEPKQFTNNLEWLKSQPELIYIALLNLAYYEFNGFLRIPTTRIEITVKSIRNIISIKK